MCVDKSSSFQLSLLTPIPSQTYTMEIDKYTSTPLYFFFLIPKVNMKFD